MSKNRSPFIIAMILTSLVGLGVAFQNCAQPLDPSLLEDNSINPSTETDDNGGSKASLDLSNIDVTFAMYDAPFIEGKEIYIYASGISDIEADATFEYKQNGNKVSDTQNLITNSLKVGDKLTLVVNYNGDSRTYDVPIEITEGSGTVNPVDPSDPPLTTTAQLQITNESGKPDLKPHHVADGTFLNFKVQLDFAADSRLQSDNGFVSYEWEKKVLRKSSTADSTTYKRLTTSGDSLNAIASKNHIAIYYRVRAFDKRNANRKSAWKYFSVIASHYKASKGLKAKYSPRTTDSTLNTNTNVTQCENPYFATGVYAQRGYNNITGLRCQLVYKKNSESWYGATKVHVYDRFYKSGTSTCNNQPLGTISNLLLTGVLHSSATGSYAWSAEKGLYRECHTLGSGAVFKDSGTRVTVGNVVTSSSTAVAYKGCPNNQYIIGLTRAGSYHLEYLHCASHQ